MKLSDMLITGSHLRDLHCTLKVGAAHQERFPHDHMIRIKNELWLLALRCNVNLWITFVYNSEILTESSQDTYLCVNQDLVILGYANFMSTHTLSSATAGTDSCSWSAREKARCAHCTASSGLAPSCELVEPCNNDLLIWWNLNARRSRCFLMVNNNLGIKAYNWTTYGLRGKQTQALLIV